LRHGSCGTYRHARENPGAQYLTHPGQAAHKHRREAGRMHLLRSTRLDGALKRTLDVVVAASVLMLLAPLFVVIAATIKLESPGGVLYRCRRVGRGGRELQMLKFRKMHDGARGPALVQEKDERFTRIGAFLARTKLDELPQLWNVVVGDMSIVGPRPESLDFFDCFTGSYLKVLDYTPGIFGPSQVAFRDERSLYPANSDPVQFYRDVLFPMKARIDLSYFSHRTISSDVRWIVCGVLAVAGHRLLPAKWWLERMPESWVSASQLYADPASQGRK
jgi:lipopolysaccharide/colanic/teichoic acid biosynthesis glycosyltransferase